MKKGIHPEYYTLDKAEDMLFGALGTPERNEYEQEKKSMFTILTKEEVERGKPDCINYVVSW